MSGKQRAPAHPRVHRKPPAPWASGWCRHEALLGRVLGFKVLPWSPCSFPFLVFFTFMGLL